MISSPHQTQEDETATLMRYRILSARVLNGRCTSRQLTEFFSFHTGFTALFTVPVRCRQWDAIDSPVSKSRSCCRVLRVVVDDVNDVIQRQAVGSLPRWEKKKRFKPKHNNSP
jgi:hypothetical protein